MLDTLRPDSGAAKQIDVTREFLEYGTILYEHSEDRLYLRNGRENLSSRRFSESLLDASQTQRAQVRKGRASKSCKPAVVKD